MSARTLLYLSFAAFVSTGCGDTAARPGSAAQNTAPRSGGADDGSAAAAPASRLPGNANLAADPRDAGRNDATNTRRNRRDRDPNALTADNQSESRDDLQTAAAIRRSITKDDSLSTNAHNVKIIARDGTVTLRGPVDSDDEKTTIVNDAKRVARGARIVDELEVGKTQLK